MASLKDKNATWRSLKEAIGLPHDQSYLLPMMTSPKGQKATSWSSLGEAI